MALKVSSDIQILMVLNASKKLSFLIKVAIADLHFLVPNDHLPILGVSDVNDNFANRQISYVLNHNFANKQISYVLKLNLRESQ